MMKKCFYIFYLCLIAKIAFSEGEPAVENEITLILEKFVTNSPGMVYAWVKCTYSPQREVLVNRKDFFIRQHLEGEKRYSSNHVEVVSKVNVVDVSHGVDNTGAKHDWIYLDAGDAITLRISVPFESINIVNKAILWGEYLCRQPDPMEKVPVLTNKIVSAPLTLYYTNCRWKPGRIGVR
ncbi:MAG: hypothetical protein WC381_05725 [Kiritimatiellia bacterium]|jgi:hypothetical protein